MPYVKKEQRQAAVADGPSNAGELNFLMTVLIRSYLRSKGTSYQTMNDIVGALECCKLEFTRRVVSPYEDVKIKENGDLW